MQQTPAHDHANPDLLACMPAVQRVVEVGCSRGALARAYKRLHPDCHYLGIEIDSDSARAARDHCDEVELGDIEDLFAQAALAGLEPADCWVFGDTLEHLRDPWQTLRNLQPLLRADGCVCACIPNMQHWSIQLRLVTGRLDYADSGLLDRTHLRWFTRLTMLQLFESCGYRVALIKPRLFAHPHSQQASALIGQLARAIGHDPDQAIEDALPLQYVIRAVLR